LRKEVLLLIAKQFWTNVFKSRTIYLLLGLTAVLLFYATYSGVQYQNQNDFGKKHQQMARDSWEANPDKHPHRMAHFGTFAFRLKHPLSTFDFGIENFTGNAIFLEAHRQNSVVFSEASFSTALIRFGELSMAMILQIIFPLLIFFIGYSTVVADRENGTLKILLAQGASWKEILYGKSLGLFSVSLLFYLPFVIVAVLVLVRQNHVIIDDWNRIATILIAYLVYVAILVMFTIIISVSSSSSKSALVKLLGLWLLLVIVLPRTSQAIGSYLYPTPSKLEFKSAIEKDIIQFGDSHDPNDPFFEKIRDSVLAVHGVQSIEELPFNFSGFQMSIGEKISAETFKRHHNDLMKQYHHQNIITKWAALINPFLGIKNLSMSLCGTSLKSYEYFLEHAENYRYKLAQKMNELQMEYIKANVSSSEGKVNVVDHKEWQSFPDFSYKFPSAKQLIKSEVIALISIFLWLVFSIGLLNYWSKKASAL